MVFLNLMPDLNSLAVTYKWSRRRQTIGLTVTIHGNLVVYAPQGTPEAKIAQVLARHRAWIERKAAARKEACARLKDGLAFFLGKPYRLTVVSGNPETVELTADEIRMRLSRAGSPRWPQLQAWYRQQAELHIAGRLCHYGAQMGLEVGQVQVRDWKSRWGECRPGLSKSLRFNWRLIMLPGEIIDYVVVHELAHLKEPGHTPRFWAQVGRVMFDYAARRRWLNRYGAPFLLWRLQDDRQPQGQSC